MGFKRGCDGWLKWSGLKDSEAGTYLTSATIPYTLTLPSGTVVGSGSLTYTGVPDPDDPDEYPDGNYRADIDADVTALMTAGTVRVVMVATQGAYKDTRDYWEYVETRGKT